MIKRFSITGNVIKAGCLALAFGTIYQTSAQDMQADNMLAYQRAIGGWPKHINEVKIDYNKPLFEEQKLDLRSDSLKKDATIDNGATVKEIRYLASAFKKHNNPAYLAAAEKGVRYLLKAQYPVGGWPQFYPDSSLYRGEITFNDNAMINVLELMLDVKNGRNDLDIISRKLVPECTAAIEKGINCILLTQVKVNGKPTVWCAQYNQKTLQPATARKYELPSLSGSESVAITRFLMKVDQPSQAVKAAVKSAVEWFKTSRIEGYKFASVPDAAQPNGRDRKLIAEPGSVIWARFYDLDTNEPFFCGRDGIKKKKVSEIEYERRNGYAWYGTWPQQLLEQEFPSWLKKNA